MAVNENLYSWMLKVHGMPAAEWYRSNPSKPPASNPFLPKGAYVPQANKGPRGETFASVSPDIIESSVIEPAQKSAPAETEDQKFERYYNQAKQQYEESNKGKPTYSAAEFPSAKLGPNISYMPEYGQYGGYFSRENLGYNLSSSLYKRYQEAVDKIPLPYQDDYGQVGYRALYGTSPGGNAENYQKVLENEKARQAREQAFQDLYQKPLNAAKYQSVSDAPSRAEYRQQLIDLGIEIPIEQNYTYFERAATAEDYEPQYYGLGNVGRQDYRQQRSNEAIAKNFEILQQQAASGNQSSQDFLDNYTAQNQGPALEEEGAGSKGPRGENMGDIAVQYGDGFPKKERWMIQLEREYNKVKDKPFSPGTPKPGRGMGDTWEGPVREAEAPAFDEQKAMIASQAAGKYRQRGQVEDPFRSGAVG